MIVVVGSPKLVAGSGEEPAQPGGLAAGIAALAASDGARVQLIGKIGDDAAGDTLVTALARQGVGHAALLRVPGHATPTAPLPPLENGPVPAEETQTGEWAESPRAAPTQRVHTQEAPLAALELKPADLELALRYLDGFDVLVIAEALPEGSPEIVLDAVGYANARLVVIVPDGGKPPELPGDAIALGAPPEDPDGVFAETVGRLAVALDRGRTAKEALESAAEAAGWQSTGVSQPRRG